MRLILQLGGRKNQRKGGRPYPRQRPVEEGMEMGCVLGDICTPKAQSALDGAGMDAALVYQCSSQKNAEARQ